MELSSIRSLFGPSSLFLLLNLVIATIAVISARHRSHRSAAGRDHPHDQQQRPLARSSSSNVMERVRSFGLFRFRSGDLPPVVDVDTASSSSAPQEQQDQPTVHQEHQQFRRIHSESDSKTAESKAKDMKKSSSAMTATWQPEAEEVEITRRRPAAVPDEEVDAKADDFINRFRQQLKLQRLDSLLRYKEMLTNRK